MATADAFQFKPISIQTRDVQTILKCGPAHVHHLAVTGVLTRIWPRGSGQGKRCYYLTEEVEIYARTRDPEAVRAYRERKAEEEATAKTPKRSKPKR